METSFPTKPGSHGRKSSRPKWHALLGNMYTESLMPILQPRLGLVLCMHHVSPPAGVPLWCGRDPQVLYRENIAEAQLDFDLSVVARVEQLNSFHKMLLCLYYSLKDNQATKKVLPLDDSNLVTHLITTWWRIPLLSALELSYSSLRTSRIMWSVIPCHAVQ